MKIDQHPFPAGTVNIVDFKSRKTKVLMLERAKNSGSVDPNVQISADEVKMKNYQAYNDSRYEQEQSSRANTGRRQRVMSQMLLKKYQRQ
jgi:hypothetical protein